jgi:hypothetical protein
MTKDVYERRRQTLAQASRHAKWYEGLGPRHETNLPEQHKQQQRHSAQRRRREDEENSR